jgi:DNA replication protein DnaC
LTPTRRRDVTCPGGCGKTVPLAEVEVLGDALAFPVQCDECFAREEAEAHESRVRDLFVTSGVRRRMRDWSLATYPRDARTREPFAVARRWLDGYRQGERRNLLMYGGVGVGKTGLAWSILRELIVEGRPGLIIGFRELLWEVRQSFRTGDPCVTAERAQRVPVFVLDDLGAERPTEFARDELAVIVERRYASQRPMIVTSNYEPGFLARRLGRDDPEAGQRIVSRLTEDAVQLRFRGPDRRLA